MIRNLLSLLLLFGYATSFAQKSITGQVTDENGIPLLNASVTVKETGAGVSTNAEGRYTIQLTASAKTLVFSYVGRKTQNEKIENRTVIDVSLAVDAGAVGEEVVVVAYGNQRRSSFTGTASTVKAEAIENRPVTSFEKALQGQAPGITVQSASGQPGASSTVRIRGVGSFTASNSPLYVLDGVAITEGDLLQSGFTGNVLSTLDPRDIESVTVLKDATAAGLYGSRAANGVVAITTKKGKAGKSSVNFTANNGFSSIAANRHSIMNGQEYFKYWWDYYYGQNIANGTTPEAAALAANTSTIAAFNSNPYSTAQPYGASGVINPGVSLLFDTDWRNAVLQQGRTEDYSVAVSGGNDKTKFYLSGGYVSQKGVVIASDFKRYSMKLNIENATTSFLRLGVNTTLGYTDQNTAPGGGGAANPIRFSEQAASVYPLYLLDADGRPIADPAGGYRYFYRTPIALDYNPVGLGKKNVYNARTVRGITSGFAEISFLKDFKIKSLGTIDFVDILETQYYNPVNGDGAGVKGRTIKYRPRDITLTITNTLSYDKNFSDHSVSVLLGQEAVKSRYENVIANGTGFPFDGIIELASASTPVDVSSSIRERRIYSLFSRVNYDYADKYYVTGSVRRDGSSVFGDESKYGVFWTVGGGWRIGKENFLANAYWLDELKLKASYGISGNDRIGEYQRLGLYGTGWNYGGNPGITYSQLANPLLRWEQNKVLDVGIELAVAKKIRAEFTYFTRLSSDVLFSQPLSYLTGFASVITNLANIKNSGFEGMIEATIIDNKNFKWVSSVNLTTTKNVIQKMTVDSIIQTNLRWKVGKDRYQWYIRDWAGVDPTDGAPTWYMDEVVGGVATGKKITTKNWNTATRYEMGSSLPKFYGGFNNNFTFQNIDLSILTFFSVGAKIYDVSMAQLMHGGANPGYQLSTFAFNAWKEPGQLTDVPKFVPRNTDLASSTSSRFLVDGSYLRLKNIALGYRLPKLVLDRLGVASFRVFVSAENVATFAKHKGMDPEVAIGGTSENNVPIVKTFTVGVNVGF